MYFDHLMVVKAPFYKVKTTPTFRTVNKNSCTTISLSLIISKKNPRVEKIQVSTKVNYINFRYVSLIIQPYNSCSIPVHLQGVFLLLFVCLSVSVDTWQLPGLVRTVFLASFCNWFAITSFPGLRENKVFIKFINFLNIYILLESSYVHSSLIKSFKNKFHLNESLTFWEKITEINNVTSQMTTNIPILAISTISVPNVSYSME